MGLIFCDISAIELYRMDCPTGPFAGSAAQAWAQGERENLAERADACFSQARYLPHPRHLLVPSSVKRRSSEEVVYHVLGAALPSGALRSMAPGEFVVSPECCLYEVARTMDLLETVLLGYEFCGCYSFDREGACAFDAREPLTDLGRIRRFVSSMGGAYGMRHLRRALPHIAEGSFSPAETAVAMLVSLPCRYGGFGLPRPQLNYRVDPGARQRTAVGKEYYLCDLFWPEARVAVEYDSDLFHTGADRIARDALRRTDLAHLGITVLTLTKGQLYDVRAFARFARTLARLLETRVRIRLDDFALRHQLLRATVLSRTVVGRRGRILE